MKETITVFTGEVKTGDETVDLKSSPIGSCVVATLFDEKIKMGAMAHIMLPGKAPDKKHAEKCKYAVDAIDKLLASFKNPGVLQENLKAVLVGGGNVLKRENDTIGIDNLTSVLTQLKVNKIPVLAQSVGGTNRKSVRFDIEERIIYFTEGDSKEKILFEFSHKDQ